MYFLKFQQYRSVINKNKESIIIHYKLVYLCPLVFLHRDNFLIINVLTKKYLWYQNT